MSVRSRVAPLTRLLERMRGSSLEPRDHAQEGKPVENVDALAAGNPIHSVNDAADLAVGQGYPPGYVKSYDEGRPRH